MSVIVSLDRCRLIAIKTPVVADFSNAAAQLLLDALKNRLQEDKAFTAGNAEAKAGGNGDYYELDPETCAIIVKLREQIPSIEALFMQDWAGLNFLIAVAEEFLKIHKK